MIARRHERKTEQGMMRGEEESREKPYNFLTDLLLIPARLQVYRAGPEPDIVTVVTM